MAIRHMTPCVTMIFHYPQDKNASTYHLTVQSPQVPPCPYALSHTRVPVCARAGAHMCACMCAHVRLRLGARSRACAARAVSSVVWRSGGMSHCGTFRCGHVYHDAYTPGILVKCVSRVTTWILCVGSPRARAIVVNHWGTTGCAWIAHVGTRLALHCSVHAGIDGAAGHERFAGWARER